MMNCFFRKSSAVLIIVLFVGASALSSISGKFNENEINIDYDCKLCNNIIKYKNHMIYYIESQNTVRYYMNLRNNDDYLDQYNEDPSYVFIGIYACNLAQSFKPALNKLTRVELFLSTADINTQGNMKIEIRDNLDSTSLTSALIPVSSVDWSENWAWVEFDFEDISVIPENTYYIIWIPDSSWNDEFFIAWGFSNGDTYSRGMALNNCGQPWGPFEDPEVNDFCFRTYGSAITVDSISGGFRVSAKVKNNGNTTAYDVPWSIDMSDCFYIRPDDKHQVGVIDEIPAGGSKSIRQKSLFAIGMNVGITVSAGDDTMQKTASWVLGPLVLGLH
jgi:hypothetical protein